MGTAPDAERMGPDMAFVLTVTGVLGAFMLTLEVLR